MTRVITSEQRVNDFKKDLGALLKKHAADIELEDMNRSGYDGADEVIKCYMESVYDEDGNHIKEEAEIDFGKHIIVSDEGIAE